MQHILPSLAPHLFPDNFNRRGSPRVVLGIPIQYRFGNTIAAALTLNLSHGGIAIRTTSPLDSGSKIKVRFRMPGSQAGHRRRRARRVERPPRRHGHPVRDRRSRQPDHHRQLRRRALLLQPKSLRSVVSDRSGPIVQITSMRSPSIRPGSVAARWRCSRWCCANGFFVAAEFSIVTVRKTRIDQLIAEGHRGARAVRRARQPAPTATSPRRSSASRWPASASAGLASRRSPRSSQPALTFLPAASGANATAHSIAVADRVRADHRPSTSSSASWRRRWIALERAEATALLGRQAARALHARVLAVHPLLHGAAQARRQAARPAAAPSRRGMVHSEEELKMLVTASQEAGVLEEAGGADAPPRLRLRRSHRRPGDGAAHRAGRGSAPTRRCGARRA